MSRNLLILSYYFPPVPGVGGRRWAKFVKFLSHNKSVKITVVSCRNTVRKLKSPFMKDLDGVAYDHITLSPRYPLYMQNMEYPRKSLVASVGFRLQRLYTMLFAKGNYYDYTVFWKKHVDREIADLISRKKIDTVIISGPPFRYVLYALDLKKRFSQLKIIYDSRDPWNDFNHPPHISQKRLDFEREAELTVLRQADAILAVSPFQRDLLLAKTNQIAPVHIVRNGYDLSDFPEAKVPDRQKKGIRIAHFGVLHEAKQYYWKPLIKALSLLRKNSPSIFDQLSFDFIGLCPDAMQRDILQTGVTVNFTGVLKIQEAYKVLNAADLVLWFKFDGSPGDFATKFGDYIALRKFIWVFTRKGDVSSYVETHKIGHVFYREDEQLTEHILERLIGLDNMATRTFNPSFNAEEWDIAKLSENLLQILYPAGLADNPTQ